MFDDLIEIKISCNLVHRDGLIDNSIDQRVNKIIQSKQIIKLMYFVELKS